MKKMLLQPFALGKESLDENDKTEVVFNESTPWLNPIVVVHKDSGSAVFFMKGRNPNYKVASINQKSHV